MSPRLSISGKAGHVQKWEQVQEWEWEAGTKTDCATDHVHWVPKYDNW